MLCMYKFFKMSKSSHGDINPIIYVDAKLRANTPWFIEIMVQPAKMFSEYDGRYAVSYARIVVTVFVTYWSSVPAIVMFSPSPFLSFPGAAGLSYGHIFVCSATFTLPPFLWLVFLTRMSVTDVTPLSTYDML